MIKNIICLFISLPMFSQTLEGFVFDASTKKPLPFANILFLKEEAGTVTDEKGYFSLNISGKQQDSLRISFVGYEDKFMPLHNFQENEKIKQNFELIPKVTYLDKIVLSEKKRLKKMRLGTYNKKKSYTVSMPYKNEVALFIENSQKKMGIVQEIVLYFKEEKTEKYKTLPVWFKVNFYDVRENLPGEALFSEVLLIKPAKNQTEQRVEIRKNEIPFPEEGIFVGIEAINPSGEASSDRMYITSPSLVYTHIEENNLVSRLSGRKWNKRTEKSNYKKKFYAVPRIKLIVRI